VEILERIRPVPAEPGYQRLEQALEFLEALHFTAEDIAYLRSVPALRPVPTSFFDEYLPRFRFSGEIWAVEEGTPVFAAEPLLRVTAPLPEAQLVETALLSQVLFQTTIASKAARVVEAAQERTVIEFGARRAHGIEAAALAARAAFIGGCAGTSDVEAGYRFGIPVSGTMAHSWVMAHADELDAFRRFADVYGRYAVLLLDTYDTLEAAQRVVRAGLQPAAVRLDSGNATALSGAVRRIFDEAGLTSTRIFVSGDLDEYRIAELVEAGAPVYAFGVGTALSTSSDAPSLGGIYKLVEIERAGTFVPTMKLSEGKRTYPGRKQVWRIGRGGRAEGDVLGVFNEPAPESGVPLVTCVMRNGTRQIPRKPLTAVRADSRRAVEQLPPEVRRLHDPATYDVAVSAALAALATDVAQQLKGAGTATER
jgi:nicotinate phosphoribosyltransferase